MLTNDLQYDLVEKNAERVAAVDAFKERFVSFMNNMREMGHIIVHLQLVNLPDGPNVERYNGFLPVQKGTYGADIISEFLHPADIVLEKNKDSGFYETERCVRVRVILTRWSNWSGLNYHAFANSRHI